MRHFPDSLSPFSSPDYVFEVKWDGLRCILFKDREGHVRLQDRGLHDIDHRRLAEIGGDAGRVGVPVDAGAQVERFGVGPSLSVLDLVHQEVAVQRARV